MGPVSFLASCHFWLNKCVCVCFVFWWRAWRRGRQITSERPRVWLPEAVQIVRAAAVEKLQGTGQQHPRFEIQLAGLRVEWKPLDVHRTLRGGQFVPRIPPTEAVVTYRHVVRLRRHFVQFGHLCAVVNTHYPVTPCLTSLLHIASHAW